MSVRPILLASNSPRRRELLSLTGWNFRAQPAEIDETQSAGESPADYVYRLAVGKARAAAQITLSKAMSSPPPFSLPENGEEVLILGADTIVADGQELLGKPRDAAEAASMLRQLRGREHSVFTAVCLFDPATGEQAAEVCETRVPMRDYSDTEIEDYVASGDPMDKAGAYAIQHAGFHPVDAKRLSGCYASVMGLPLCHLERAARRFGIAPAGNLPAACQAELKYDCPVYQDILGGEIQRDLPRRH